MIGPKIIFEKNSPSLRFRSYRFLIRRFHQPSVMEHQDVHSPMVWNRGPIKYDFWMAHGHPKIFDGYFWGVFFPKYFQLGSVM